MQMHSPQDAFRRLHPIINRDSSKNAGILILKNKPIRLIKRLNPRLENLLITSCLIRRIRERAMRVYRIGEHHNFPCSLTLTPTSCYREPYSRIEDYGLKRSIENASEKKEHRAISLDPASHIGNQVRL
jgi:hypothetical protein